MHKILSAGRHQVTYNVTCHKHEYWELVYCTEGSGRFLLRDGTSMPYEKGDIVCIPPLIEHSNISDEGFANIHLVMDNIDLSVAQLIKIKDNSSRILYNAFAQTFYFFNSDDTHNKFNILLNLGDLVANCIISFMDTVRYSPLVEDIRAIIIRNFSNSSFDLSQAIALHSSNPDYARKLFRKETGVTPLQFLTNTRMSYAKKLLKTNVYLDKINIAETARECGFEDALYFSRLFKKHTGTSPSSYRNSD